MAAYYNEIEPYAAAWLRNLIAAGHIAPGDVDERDIRDVRPSDLAGYMQCHFFAGVGVWPHALRRAGWPDDRPVWTGSCPCQPFSQAGRGAGLADERHLWPHFHYLIEQCRPDTVFGEQVASKDGLGWLDLVQTDLEGTGYAVGAADTCAAGVGAPHIRQRLYWVADAMQPRRAEWRAEWRAVAGRGSVAGSGWVGGLADTGRQQCERRTYPERPAGEAAAEWRQGVSDDQCGGLLGRLADTPGGGSGARLRDHESSEQRGPVPADDGSPEFVGDASGQGLALGSQPAFQPGALRFQGAALGAAEPVRGYWGGADWIWCRDGKYRPVEPGSFPLAHGAPARVGRLRAYGNAICAESARVFIEAFLETQAG